MMANLPVFRFWDKYIKKTRRYKIRPEIARWYVRRAEQYIKSHAGSRLSDHEAHYIEKYLDVKGRNPHLEDWQFQQLVMELKILFIELVGASWAKEYRWQYLFPSSKISADPRSGETCRHHVHENGLQKTIKKGGEQAGIMKRVNCHALRHSFATHLLQAGYDIRTVRDRSSLWQSVQRLEWSCRWNPMINIYPLSPGAVCQCSA